jgi:hypothetical protein
LCDSVCQWAKMWHDGWLVVAKRLAEVWGGRFRVEAPHEYILFVLIPWDRLILCC